MTSLNRPGHSLLKVREWASDHGIQDLAIGALVFALSYSFAQFYTDGDQVGYRKAYIAVRGVDPLVGFSLYKSFISTVELGHYVVVYIASNLLIEKNVAFSYLNGILAILISRTLRAAGAGPVVALPLIFANFYVLVLYFAAERLKIAVIFLLLTNEFARSSVPRYVMGALAVWSHFTIALLLGRVVESLGKLLAPKDNPGLRVVVVFAVTVVGALAALFIAKDYLIWKAMQYYEIADNSVFSAVPLLLCIGMALYYSREKPLVFVDFLPIVVAFVFLGGSRVNMFAYIAFLRHGVQANRGINLGVLATTAYLAYKCIAFLGDVVRTGQGF